MKIEFIKQPGGMLVPASDIESKKMSRFTTGEMYTVDITLSRNAAFHRKVFVFFNFCFDFWKAGNKYIDEPKQFDLFRENMIVLAGYHDEYYTIDGRVRVEAKSISYANMSQEEFEGLYSSLINVALAKIFVGANEGIEAQLYGFF